MDVYGIIFYILTVVVFGVEGWLVWDVSHWIVDDLVNRNKEEF